MQISKLYETKLECSSYNVNIGSTDTTVTLTLVDFNGSPVTNTAVTLKADNGYFTKAVGKTTTTYTDASATKTINATTDNNGKVVATWTASEWGLCTFSANNNSIQTRTKGYKLHTDSRFKIRYNEDIVIFEMNWQLTTDLNNNGSWNTLTSISIPEDLRPPDVRAITALNYHDVTFVIETDGTAKYYNNQSAKVQSPLLNFNLMWRKK